MPTPAGDTVRLRLVAYLAEKHISQRKLAVRLGWTQPRVHRRLSGDTPISIDDLQSIANALDEPMDRFLAGAA